MAGRAKPRGFEYAQTQAHGKEEGSGRDGLEAVVSTHRWGKGERTHPEVASAAQAGLSGHFADADSAVPSRRL